MSRKSDEKQSRAPEADFDLDVDVEAAWCFVGVCMSHMSHMTQYVTYDMT